MNKPISLLFSVIAVLLLVGAGVSLGFNQTLLALICFLLFITVMGLGFMLKARMQNTNQS